MSQVKRTHNVHVRSSHHTYRYMYMYMYIQGYCNSVGQFHRGSSPGVTPEAHATLIARISLVQENTASFVCHCKTLHENAILKAVNVFCLCGIAYCNEEQKASVRVVFTVCTSHHVV